MRGAAGAYQRWLCGMASCGGAAALHTLQPSRRADGFFLHRLPSPRAAPALWISGRDTPSWVAGELERLDAMREGKLTASG